MDQLLITPEKPVGRITEREFAKKILQVTKKEVGEAYHEFLGTCLLHLQDPAIGNEICGSIIWRFANGDGESISIEAISNEINLASACLRIELVKQIKAELKLT